MLLQDVILQIAPERVPVGTRAHRRREILGLTPDARRVTPGTVFVALPDRCRADPYAAYMALDRGAEAVICEPETILPKGVARIEVPDCRKAFAKAAAAFFGNPERSLSVHGFRQDPGDSLGTRRASTNAAHLLAGLLASTKRPTPCFTELACEATGRTIPCALSELDLFEWFEWLALAVRSGENRVVIEATPNVEAALGPDFPWQWSSPGILPHDSFQGSWKGTVGYLGQYTVSTLLVGFYNWMALNRAVTTASTVAPLQEWVGRVSRLKPTQGFLEPVLLGQPFGVFVDAARTPLELRDLLSDVRQFHSGRILLVVGAPATMESDERESLGQATILADHVVVTSNDPEYESIDALSADLIAAAGLDRVTLDTDRESAIFKTISMARTGDVVLVTGKAHRRSESIQGARIPWDDRQILSAALAHRGYSGSHF